MSLCVALEICYYYNVICKELFKKILLKLHTRSKTRILSNFDKRIIIDIFEIFMTKKGKGKVQKTFF